VPTTLCPEFWPDGQHKKEDITAHEQEALNELSNTKYAAK